MTRPAEPLRVDFHLLDREIIDHQGGKIGKVDDVELEVAPDGQVRIAALLVGQRVLGQRIGGWVGRWLAAIASRMHHEDDPGPLRIPFEQVTDVGSAITVGVRRDLLDRPPLEAWLHDRFISRIPGADHASQ
jgi:sporulation protein YlmC with PRC-barrel domain